MAYTRYTGGTFGIYRTYRDGKGKRREECLVRLGQYETPVAAEAGYLAEVLDLRSRARRLRGLGIRETRQNRIDRLDLLREARRLAVKLRAVKRFMAEHPEYAAAQSETEATEASQSDAC